jgi:mono/diheme cytochrome c family protein
MRKFLLGFVVGMLTLAAGAFAAVWLVWLPTNANATSSTLEKVFAHVALDRAAARHAPHLVNPIAPIEENLMAGMRLFKGDCAGCHGDPNNAAKREAESGGWRGKHRRARYRTPPLIIQNS